MRLRLNLPYPGSKYNILYLHNDNPGKSVPQLTLGNAEYIEYLPTSETIPDSPQITEQNQKYGKTYDAD
jgi:hypothetical protein